MGLYSQNDEDIVVLKYFGKKKGFFVEIGSNDGATLSNTKALIQKGWIGIMVEPDIGAFKSAVSKNYKGVYCVNAAIGDTTGIVSFNTSKDSLLSTLKDELIPRWSNITTFEKSTCLSYTWIDFLIEINKFLGKDIEQKIDFISIDAEGMDWVILQQIDLTNVQCICIEYGDKEQQIIDYCSRYDMKRIYKSGENLIFVK